MLVSLLSLFQNLILYSHDPQLPSHCLEKSFQKKTFHFYQPLRIGLGLGSFLLLFSFVASEWTYNDFHANKENIYRVV
jgi:hypothetical protein